MCGGLDMAGDWAFEYDGDGAFRCFAVISGDCWLSLADGSHPMPFTEGDFFALPHGKAFALASDPAIPARPIGEAISEPLQGRVLTMGGGGGCRFFGALFTFRPHLADHLLNALPQVLRVSKDQDRTALKSYLSRMMDLLSVPQPGGVLTTEHLGETMLIEILRQHLAQEAAMSVGWLLGLADKQLNRAITAMHEQPARRWTVHDLAGLAGMSRSAFSERFKAKTGLSVMGYLTRWRMLLAADRVVSSSEPISHIASLLGYESESAFVFAFRREMGFTPRQYGRRAASAVNPGSAEAKSR